MRNLSLSRNRAFGDGVANSAPFHQGATKQRSQSIKRDVEAVLRGAGLTVRNSSLFRNRKKSDIWLAVSSIQHWYTKARSNQAPRASGSMSSSLCGV